jgi:hypothetical protein
VLKNVEGVKEKPHGMRRIGEAAVDERVRGEQIAEFVMNAGRADGKNGK